jgi:hypothetical protein
LKKSERIWWLKIVAALILAVICVFIQTYFTLPGITVLMLGIILYLGLSDLFAITMKVDRRRSFKIGVGVFIFTWLTVWTLLYTLIQTM